MKVIDVPVDKIQIGDRHRRDLGDLESLAANIREIGLLQPIGIDEYFTLIYGQRRLEACGLILGWKQIPCVVVELESVLLGEYAENEFRKQFTKTERIAIGQAIEDHYGDRRGGDRRSERANARDEPKGETLDIAAKAAGFTSRETYERAKTVIEHGTPELQAAMDKREVSISAAAAIASQPAPEQNRIVAMPVTERREIVRQIRNTKADREADERRARDIRLLRGLYDAVKFISDFQEPPKETWEGLWRVSAYDFSDHLSRALQYLPRLKKEHPNEAQRPIKVS